MPTMTSSSLQMRRASARANQPAAPCESAGRNQRDHQHDSRQRASARQAKVLTNFSIDSIIGPESNKLARSRSTEKLLPPTDNDALQTLELISRVDIGAHFIPHRLSDSNSNTSLQLPALAQPAQDGKKHRPKNFQCPACCMAFSNNGQLKNHVRIHTGERPFQCNHYNCGKTFTRNEELTRHKLIHTGARPHACSNCSKRFGRKDHLKKHVKTHERKKLRKSCYAPHPSRKIDGTELDRSPYEFAEQMGAGLLFSPKKEHMLNEEQSASSSRMNAPSVTDILPVRVQNHAGPQYNQYSESLALLKAPTIPPVTFAPIPHFINQSTTMAAIAAGSASLGMLSSTAGGPLQQLGDYWQRWYNFLGMYQNPPTNIK